MVLTHVHVVLEFDGQKCGKLLELHLVKPIGCAQLLSQLLSDVIHTRIKVDGSITERNPALGAYQRSGLHKHSFDPQD